MSDPDQYAFDFGPFELSGEPTQPLFPLAPPACRSCRRELCEYLDKYYGEAVWGNDFCKQCRETKYRSYF